MGLYGGGSNITYQAPVIPKDDTFEKFLTYQTTKDAAADKRAADERADAKAEAAAAKAAVEGAAAAKRSAAQAAMPTLRTSLQSQLSSGLISYEDATSQLRAQADKGETDANESIAELTNLYTNQILPGRRATGIGAAYEEILGRQATEEEKSKAMERFSQGYYTSNEELRNSLYKSTEYTDKFNKSYLDNYYDTMFGQVKEQVNAPLNFRLTFFRKWQKELQVALELLRRSLVTLLELLLKLKSSNRTSVTPVSICTVLV